METGGTRTTLSTFNTPGRIVYSRALRCGDCGLLLGISPRPQKQTICYEIPCALVLSNDPARITELEDEIGLDRPRVVNLFLALCWHREFLPFWFALDAEPSDDFKLAALRTLMDWHGLRLDTLGKPDTDLPNLPRWTAPDSF